MYGSDHRGNPVHAGKVTNDFFKRTNLSDREMSGNYRNTPRVAAITGQSQEELNNYRKQRDFLTTTDPRTEELLTGQEYPETEVEELGLENLQQHMADRGQDFEGYNDTKEDIGSWIEDRRRPEGYTYSDDLSSRQPYGTFIETGRYPGSPGGPDMRTPEQKAKALAPQRKLPSTTLRVKA